MNTRRWGLVAVLAVVLALLMAGPAFAGGHPDGPPGLKRAIAAQEAHTDALMATPGVVGTAVGLGANGNAVVLILTEAAGVAGLPSELDGVAVRVKVTGEIVALEPPEGQGKPSKVDPTARFDRPVPIGVSTGHPLITAGTIGARVTDGTSVFALSNNHIYAATNCASPCSIGDPALQPGPFDGGKAADDIGTLFAFQPIDFSGGDNTIDAAIALSSTANLGNATPSDGYGTPNSATVSASIDQEVQKYGRTTGLTKGKVSGINATVNVNYGDPNGVARFVNQILITPGKFSKGGDSGSLIVTRDGNKNPVGLLFAGSVLVTIANPIDAVLNWFGVTVDGEGSAPTPPPLPTTGSIAGTVTNAADGTPVSGATVVIDTGESTTTGDDGSYSITGVPTGDRSVTASATGFESQTKPATVNEDPTPTTVDFALVEATETTTLSVTIATPVVGSTFKLGETVQISGQVTDGSVGVAGATVTLIINPPKGPNLTPVNPPVTDGSGNYSFDFKTSKRTGAGSYTVTATAEKDGTESNTATKNFEVTK